MGGAKASLRNRSTEDSLLSARDKEGERRERKNEGRVGIGRFYARSRPNTTRLNAVRSRGYRLNYYIEYAWYVYNLTAFVRGCSLAGVRGWSR